MPIWHPQGMPGAECQGQQHTFREYSQTLVFLALALYNHSLVCYV